MTFDDWYRETYNPDFGNEHKEWEMKAWNAAIKQAEDVAHNFCLGEDSYGRDYFAHDVAVEIKYLIKEASK